MAIKRPDIYEHNNPNLPIVASKDVMGGALFTADLTTLLTDFAGKEAKLLNGATKVYVISEGVDYRLIDKLAVGVIGSWEVVAGGGNNIHRGDATRSGDDYNVTLSPAITAYEVNHLYLVTLTGSNVSASKISFNGLTPLDLVSYNNSYPFAGGELLDGATYLMTYDGVSIVVLSYVPAGGAPAFIDVTGSPNDNVALKAALDAKLDKTDYNQHFRGKFISKVALDTNVFTPALISGDYAQVDEGVGEDVVNYNWDADDSVWIVGGSGSGATDTDGLPEGSVNFYWTSARVAEIKKDYELQFQYREGTMYENIVAVQFNAGNINAINGVGITNIKVATTYAGTYTTASLPMAVSAGNLFFKFDYVSDLIGTIKITGKDT